MRPHRRQPARLRVQVSFEGKDRLVLSDQVRVLDRRRLIKPMRNPDRQTLAAVPGALSDMFAWTGTHAAGRLIGSRQYTRAFGLIYSMSSVSV